MHLEERMGGLLNATVGNATELIIALFALKAGEQGVVKASISGSIIGNTLLVSGTSTVAGGWGREKQTFSRKHVGANVTMLFIASAALVVPAVFELAVYSLVTSVVLFRALWAEHPVQSSQQGQARPIK